MNQNQRTSFFALGDAPKDVDGVQIQRVEIPLFQRDYAQGRTDERVEAIRTDFLDVLYEAVSGGETEAVGLDFVYGDIHHDGETNALRPLDGQQRLTTLFLLHWYLASASGHLGEGRSWEKFTYSTRQSAQMFCESLVLHPWPGDLKPSKWIKDEPWYLFVWRHDPSIQSMLVVLDAIHERFSDLDAAAAWARLTDTEAPAIWFLLLPLSGMGDGAKAMRAEDLYIKMNSRGKPLTDFENFKAQFEETIQWSDKASDLAQKVDTEWSDLLWDHRGDDGVIDDEFLRYLDFVTEICEWREGRTSGSRLKRRDRTNAVFGADHPQREANLDFLFRAFDVWVAHPPNQTLGVLFADAGEHDSTRLPLYFKNTGDATESLNLFEACCRSYGGMSGKVRSFSLGQSVMLYAVLLHLIEETPDFARRIRVLRNLVEASSDELRPERMPSIVDDVYRVIRDGAIQDVAALNQAQKDDELLKADFVVSNPGLRDALYALEDQELLRGSICAFELEPMGFEARAATFEQLMSQPELWTDLLAALLATGEYQRQRTHSRSFRFGTDSKKHDSAWRELLTGPGRDRLRQTREVLCEFLDRVSASPAPVDEAMRSIADEYLARCVEASHFDWRYYMVKYPSMRERGSHTYFAEHAEDSEALTMGYSLCMLVAGKKNLSSNYHDPYLLTICHELDNWDAVQYELFHGYEDEPRRMLLTQSSTSIRCVPSGFQLGSPDVAPYISRFNQAREVLGLDDDNLSRIPQADVSGRRVDTVDRIQKGVDIVRRLLAAGL